jgi:hypothetical protein
MAGDPLTVSLEARLDKLQKNFSDAAKMADDSVNKIEESFKNANPDAKGLLESFKNAAAAPAREAGTVIGAALAAAIGASLAGGAALVKVAEGLAALGDRADEMRLPVNLLQALSVAADEARVPTEKLNSALDEFTKVSKQDEDDASKFYKALGNVSAASVEAFKNADTQSQRLRVLADAFKSTTDEVKRAQLAQQAFGTDSEKVIKLFAGGSDGLDQYIERARQLGLAIDVNMVKQAQAAKSELRLLSRVLTDEFSTSLSGLIPILTKLLPFFQALVMGAQAVASIIATDANASIKQLSDELEGQSKLLGKLQAQRDQIAKSMPAPGELDLTNLNMRNIRQFFGLGDQNDYAGDLAAVDKDIADRKARIEVLQALINQKKKLDDSSDQGGFKRRPSLDDSSTSKDAFTREIDTLNRRSAAFDAETQAVGRGTRAQAEYFANGQLIEALNRAGIEITPQYAATIETLSKRYAEAAGAAANAKLAFQQQQDLIRFGGDQLISIMDGLRNKTLSAQQAVMQLANAFINAAEKALLLGQGPLAGLFGTAAAAGSGGTGGLLGALFGGARANGGPVDAGKAYLVNENTPNSEIFVPKVSGMIVPTAAASPSGGGVVVVVNITNAPTFQAGMTPTDVAAMRSLVETNGRQLRSQVVSDIRGGLRRDGGFLSR